MKSRLVAARLMAAASIVVAGLFPAGFLYIGSPLQRTLGGNPLRNVVLISLIAAVLASVAAILEDKIAWRISWSIIGVLEVVGTMVLLGFSV